MTHTSISAQRANRHLKLYVSELFFGSLFSDRAHHVSSTVLNNFNVAPPSIRANDELDIIILISYMSKLRHRI